MQQYLFEYTVTYTKGYYDSNYLQYELPGNDIPFESSTGIRLVSGEDYNDAHSNLKWYIKNDIGLNDHDMFSISITDLNI